LERGKRRTWTGIIKDCPPSANQLLRTHYRDRKALAERWYLELYAAFAHDRPTKAIGKRRVAVTVTSTRERDHANLWLGVDKLIFDNLTRLGWLVDDNPTYLDAEVKGETGDRSTSITIEEGV